MKIADFANVAPLPDLPEKAPPPRVIEIHGGPMRLSCAWCDEENGVRYFGNISHRVCYFHMVSNLWHCLEKDSIDTLFYAVLCYVGTEAA